MKRLDWNKSSGTELKTGTKSKREYPKKFKQTGTQIS